jgi:hypothetical protein
MPKIYITSGTSFTLPADWNPANNTVECYGAGAPGTATGGYNNTGGGGGAWAQVSNLNISASTAVNIQIGSTGSADTWFNATSVANAVSNGTSVSCAAKGSSSSAGGAASSSCGTSKNNGGGGGAGNGGLTFGGGGGGAGGPSGPGADGGSAGGSNSGGGGGANNGTAGASPGAGGNGRGGGGGGSSGGGNATANSGGGGGGSNGAAGGNGALDNSVYSDGSHGPGGGGGGAAVAGGNAGGYGGGGGGGYSTGGSETDGLIVLTYVSVSPSVYTFSLNVLNPPIPTLANYIVVTPLLFNQTPSQDMAWFRQPLDLLIALPKDALFSQVGFGIQPFPNLTPLIEIPFLAPHAIQWRAPLLEVRQQFPGLAPRDLSAKLIEGADTLSSFIRTTSVIYGNAIESDLLSATVTPYPATGSSVDIANRVKQLLPKGWWRFTAPLRDAILGGLADLASWSYSLIDYAKLQTRVAWATGIWLDIISNDFFGLNLPRKTNENDTNFRARIQKELIRERVTRAGMISAVSDLTGTLTTVFEPWNTGDTGAWDNGTFAYDVSGGWGDTILPAQSFLNVQPPGLQGIGGVGGWDSGYLAWDGGIGMWADMSLITGAVTTADIYATINKTRPVGSIVWTQLFAAAGPTPPPPPPSLTPLSYPPSMIQQTIYHPAAIQATMPQTQIDGSFAVNPVTPSISLPWLTSQPPIFRPAHEHTWEPVGFGSELAINPLTPTYMPPWLVVQPPIVKPFHALVWEPLNFGGAFATNPASSLGWATEYQATHPPRKS